MKSPHSHDPREPAGARPGRKSEHRRQADKDAHIHEPALRNSGAQLFVTH